MPALLIGVFGFLFFATLISYIARSSEQKVTTPAEIVTPQETITPTPTKTLVPGKDYKPGIVTVKFKSNVNPSEIQATLRKYNARVSSQIPNIGVTVLEVEPGKEDFVIKSLTEDGLVQYAELDFTREDHAFTPNDPDFTKQYGLVKIHAPEAWDITRGKGVVIANIQNQGADVTHPDLKPNVQAGSGSIEHGTHTSGIIAAATNNAQGVAGTCPECKLIVQNVNGYTATTISQAITASADQGAKVINMSFGGASASQTEKDAVAYAWNKGVVLVASAGNDSVSTVSFPAGITNVVAVAATDANDAMATFSNFGTWVKIAAPGDKIYSTLPGGKYGLMSGTSMAAPMMAGVFGLIWSTSYGTTPDAVVKRACDTSDKIGGTGTNWQCGRVNAFAAVQGGTAVPAPSAGVAVPSGEPGSVAITPSFYPLAPCPTCSVQPTPSAPVLPSGALAIDPSGNPVFPEISGVPQLPDIGRGHAGQGGLLSILLAFILLILQFFASLFGR